MKAGILALQGDFAAHAAVIARLGAEPVLVRDANSLKNIDGLIIPGGESTVMLKLLRHGGMMEPLTAFTRAKPVFGTCAGAILLAKKITNPEQESFGVIDIDIERNAYGRQRESHMAVVEPEAAFQQRTAPGSLNAVFIRAPIIRRAGPEVKVLLRHQGTPVLVEQGRHMAATFHPEQTDDGRVHRLFLEKLAGVDAMIKACVPILSSSFRGVPLGTNPEPRSRK